MVDSFFGTTCVEEARRLAGELKSWCQAKQKGIIMAMPEIDGCFVDSHEIGRCYGTAMALLCLARSDADTPETEK